MRLFTPFHRRKQILRHSHRAAEETTNSPRQESTAASGRHDDYRYRRAEDVATEAVGDELLLVQLAQATTFRLNGTGRAVWELATEGLTVREIADRLHSSLAVPVEQIRSDAVELLEQLAESNLLDRQPEST